MKKIKILLIDDNPRENKHHENLFTKLNLAEEVIIKNTADNGLQYLNHIKNFSSPETFLVMLSLQLKNNAAFAFLKDFEQTMSMFNIVILSDAKSPDDITQLRQMGKYSILIKPLDENEMLNIYHKYFRDKTMFDQLQMA